jgi:hypothetical protein
MASKAAFPMAKYRVITMIREGPGGSGGRQKGDVALFG